MSIVSLGAGLYWSGIMTSPLAVSGAASAHPWQTALALAIAAGMALLAMRQSGENVMLPTCVVALVLCAVGGIGMALPLPDGPSYALGRLRNVGGSLLMLLWSARFVSTTRSQAFAEVAGAALLALALQCAAVALDQMLGPLPDVLGNAVSLCWTTSAALLVFLQVKTPVTNPLLECEPCPVRVRASFCLSRAALGLGLGCLQALIACAGSAARGSSVVALASGMLALACLGLLAGGRAPGAAPRLVPLIPLTVLALPAVGSAGGILRIELLYPCLWITWICLSSVQLSELKYRLGRRPLNLAFGEKALVLLSILVGQLVGNLLLSATDTGSAGRAAGLTPLAFAAALPLCLYASVSLTGLASMRDHEAFVQEVIAESREAFGYVYRQIERDFSLSGREGQILALLAQGHTQGHIAQELGVAAGTVRSHVNHIYAKTRCHSREDLLALVKKYQTERE